MEGKNGRERSSQVGERNKGSQSESQPRGMGAFSTSSASDGTYQIRASRKDSDESNTLEGAEYSVNEITGKFVSQLIDETEKQLAYHEQQSELLRNRLNELRIIPEKFLDTEKLK